jgi:putative N-acetyltransferase (TIGR04045 family)
MLELTRPYGAEVRAFTSAAISFQRAREAWQLRGDWGLRREIFCEETRLFTSQLGERDEHDRHALPMVALAQCAGAALDVVGVVRIYESEPGLWYGGRLGVSAAYRCRPRVGAGLIRTAVGTARGLGCRQFLATVLAPNASYFARQHFTPLERISVCGRSHVLMRAELEAFAIIDPPRAHEAA